MDRLLAEGVNVDLGERWNAIAGLRAVGLDDLDIADVIHAAAFFNWANRLMLSLDEPILPS